MSSCLQILTISSGLRFGRRGNEVRRVSFEFVQIGDAPRLFDLTTAIVFQMLDDFFSFHVRC